MSKIVLLYKQ